jgi:hypothetical protein
MPLSLGYVNHVSQYIYEQEYELFNIDTVTT